MSTSAASHVRPPAVAGLFYPADAAELSNAVTAYLHATKAAPFRPKALIIPHAGYVYSAPIAACAYALLAPLRGQITRVVLLGPAHRVRVPGLAVPTVDAFRTPLGNVPLDRASIKKLLSLPQVLASDAAHAQEHSLEVHLPFLQSALDHFTLVPLVVGSASPAATAEVLELLWGGSETLIIVSSDLSHYLPYDTAQQVDQLTAGQVLQLQPLFSHEQACGATPINALLEVAQRRHLQPHLLDQRNSGDTAGSKDQVVGYAAFAFEETP